MAYANRGLSCPKCEHKTFISDSVADKENNEIYRERTCTNPKCCNVFFTSEFIVEDNAVFRELWHEMKRQYNRNQKKEREKRDADQDRRTL